jgi:hypothetical protein
VPVPEVLDAVEFTDAEGRARAGLLLARLPGRPALDLTRLSVTQARQRGERCGSLHVALADVAAPPGVDAVPAIPQSSETTTPHCLLHLDLHPLNVLIDETGDVSGVLDWANTAAGPAVLDRARSWSILRRPHCTTSHTSLPCCTAGPTPPTSSSYQPRRARGPARSCCVTSTLATPPTALPTSGSASPTSKLPRLILAPRARSQVR